MRTEAHHGVLLPIQERGSLLFAMLRHEFAPVGLERVQRPAVLLRSRRSSALSTLEIHESVYTEALRHRRVVVEK